MARITYEAEQSAHYHNVPSAYQQRYKQITFPALAQEKLAHPLRHRFGVCLFIRLGNVFFGYQACRLRVHTDFFDLSPRLIPLSSSIKREAAAQISEVC